MSEDSAVITRKQAERIASETTYCSIHDRPMIEHGYADLCGTFPTFCEECGK